MNLQAVAAADAFVRLEPLAPAHRDDLRAAVTKLGAHLDGVMRQDMITWTGRIRDTAVYSVLADEWPIVRERLDERLAAFAATKFEGVTPHGR